MCFGIANKDRAVAVNKDTVRTSELALEWIRVGTIAWGSCASNQVDGAIALVDFSDDVIFRIGEIDVAVGRNTETFRSGKFRISCRPVVAAEALPPCARDAAERAFGEVECENRVTFAQSHPHVTGHVEIEGTRTAESCTRYRRVVQEGASLTSSGKSGDYSDLHIHLSDAVIFDIANVKVARLVEADAVGLVQLGFSCWTSVARKARGPGSCDGRHDAGLCVALAHGRAQAFDPIEIAGGIQALFVRLVQLR